MKRSYLVNVSALALIAVGSPAFAQAQDPSANPATPNNNVQTTSQPGAPDAVSNTTPEDTGQLGDIVVTAQRRAERAQEVPISISVVGGDALQQNGTRGLEDIRQLVPSVQYDPNNGGGFNIRGIGTQAYELTAERAVSVVLDDVVQDLPRDLGLNGLADIERIEVLRGPQGIQFGKNSSAGVISVITRRPDLTKSSGEFLVEYGERNDRKFTVSANTPLTDNLAVRVSGYNQGEDGLGRYFVLNKRLGDYKSYGVRAKVLWEPTDNLNFLLIGDANHASENSLLTGASLVGTDVPAVAALVTAAGVTIGPRNRDSASDVEGNLTTDSKGVSLTTTLGIGNHTLTSVTAYRDVSGTGNSPVEPDPVLRILPINSPVLNANKVSEELRLSSPSGGVVSYVVGLFYNRLHQQNAQEQAGTLGQPLPSNVFLSLTNGLNFLNATNESKAAFATATISPTPWFDLIIGGRVTRDTVDYRTGFSTSSCQVVSGLPLCVSSDVPYAFVPLSAGLTNGDGTGSTGKTNFSYRVAPTFKLSRDVLLFASYSTGYKGPGISQSSGTVYNFSAETVKNYELGVKSELFGRKLRFNATAFYTKFRNFQTQQQTIGSIGFITANAGGLRSQGVETEITLRATRAITLNGGVTYADTEFTDYQYTPTINYRGLPSANAPKWSYNVGANLDTALGNIFRLTGSVSYSYRSKVFLIAGDPQSIQEGYGLLNGRLGIGPEDDRWRVGVYGRNLTNRYFNTAYFDYGSFGLPFRFSQTTREAGRTIGGFVNFRL